MNEPQKNPVHLDPQQEPTSSLIERAVKAFDRGQFVPPSSPSDLVSPSLNPAHNPAAYPQGYAPQAAPAPQAPVYQAPQAPVYQAPVEPQAYAPQPAPVQHYAPVQPAAAPQAPAYAQPAAAAPHRAPQHRVDRQRLAEEGMGSGTSQVEEFRIVKRQLLQQAEDMVRRGGGGAARRIVISSPHPGEGKTFCAVNLALSIAAEKDTEVLLVDLDLARSSALAAMGLPNGAGLMDALVNPDLDVRSCVMATDIPGLSVLPGGRPTSSDAEYLASDRAERVLDLLAEGAPNRIILFDTPPALVASVAAEVAKLSGQAVLVVLADKTSGGAIQDAASLLSGCPNIQLLLNAVQFSPSGRRFGSYHGYRG